MGMPQSGSAVTCRHVICALDTTRANSIVGYPSGLFWRRSATEQRQGGLGKEQAVPGTVGRLFLAEDCTAVEPQFLVGGHQRAYPVLPA